MAQIMVHFDGGDVDENNNWRGSEMNCFACNETVQMRLLYTVHGKALVCGECGDWFVEFTFEDVRIPGREYDSMFNPVIEAAIQQAQDEGGQPEPDGLPLDWPAAEFYRQEFVAEEQRQIKLTAEAEAYDREVEKDEPYSQEEDLLNPADYADDPAEFEVQRELRRLKIKNAANPGDVCKTCGTVYEVGGGYVGESVVYCPNPECAVGIVWEDGEDAIRRAL